MNVESMLTLEQLKEQFALYEEPYNLPDAPHKLDLLRVGEQVCGSPELFRDWLEASFNIRACNIPRDMVAPLKTYLQSLDIADGKTVAEWARMGRAKFHGFDGLQPKIVYCETRMRTKYPSLLTQAEASAMINRWRPEPSPTPTTQTPAKPFLYAPRVLCLPAPQVQIVALLPAVAAGVVHVPVEVDNAPLPAAQRLTQQITVSVVEVEPAIDYTCKEPRLKDLPRTLYTPETAQLKAFTFAHHIVNSLWVKRYLQQHNHTVIDKMTITQFRAFWHAFVTSAPPEHRQYILHRVLDDLCTKEAWSEYRELLYKDYVRGRAKMTTLTGKSSAPRRLGGAA